MTVNHLVVGSSPTWGAKTNIMAELVASVRKYTGREDLVEWLHEFPTRYKAKHIRNVLDKVRDKNLVLWSLETIFDPKSNDIWVEEGVTIL
jgi:hypothetical protein